MPLESSRHDVRVEIRKEEEKKGDMIERIIEVGLWGVYMTDRALYSAATRQGDGRY